MPKFSWTSLYIASWNSKDWNECKSCKIEFCVSFKTDPIDGNGNKSLTEIWLNTLKMLSEKMNANEPWLYHGRDAKEALSLD